jgi:peptidoglycan/xylan/chitin deacetylase (PgdA/CDA1 family)
MRLVSPLLKHVVYPGLSRSGYLRRLLPSAPAVVTYHGVLPQGYELRDAALDGHLVNGSNFLVQINLLKKNYNVISPEQFLRWCEGELELPLRSVLLTCDDGLRNTLTDMLPIIADAGVSFLFFLTGASAEDTSSMLWYEEMFLWLKATSAERISSLRESWCPRRTLQLNTLWVELMKRFSAMAWPERQRALEDLRTRLGISKDWASEYSENEALNRRFFMLNRQELKQLRRAGMTIGAHTVSHPMLSQMTREDAAEEIARSRSALENAWEKKVWALAYPFGTRDTVSCREEDLARGAGFSCAFMNVEDASTDNKYMFPRIHVSLTMGLAELDAHVSGFHSAIRKLASAAVPA